jgi:hypothetical protein
LIEHVKGASDRFIQLCKYQPELAAMSDEELVLAIYITMSLSVSRPETRSMMPSVYAIQRNGMEAHIGPNAKQNTPVQASWIMNWPPRRID